jgi:hypothetical protein
MPDGQHFEGYLRVDKQAEYAGQSQTAPSFGIDKFKKIAIG